MGLVEQGVHNADLAKRLLERVLNDAGLARGDIGAIVATGYGRNAIDCADRTITEITCHARGVFYLNPHARTVIEIGGQDSKLLRLNDDGTVYDFAMNDRCAAGTGRFLEIAAERLEQDLLAFAQTAMRSIKPAAISSTCVVFAETEIIGLLAEGVAVEDIAAGILQSISLRIAAMAGRNITGPVVLTGGVALIDGMAGILAEVIGQPVGISPLPQMTGALGAAILAGR